MQHDKKSCWLCRTCVLAGLLGSFLFGGAVAAEDIAQRYEFLQIRMGIPINITLYASDQVTANQAADAAFAAFRDVDRCMSDYDPDSELMQLCSNYQPQTNVPISDELFKVLSHSQRIAEKTDGAFDVTVGPLVKIWRIARRRKVMPPASELQSAQASVGFEHLKLHSCPPQISFGQSGMRLDLGGIAKGYAADKAIAAMKRLGVTSVLVDAGGDLVAGDAPPDRTAWTITIEKLAPKAAAGKSNPTIALANAAVATSGDVYQYVEIDGRRFSHLVNPKTGLGLETPSTVTVIAPTGMQADALASAVSVLGSKAGLTFIEQQPDAEVLIVEQLSDRNLHESKSSGFQNYFTNGR